MIEATSDGPRCLVVRIDGDPHITLHRVGSIGLMVIVAHCSDLRYDGEGYWRGDTYYGPEILVKGYQIVSDLRRLRNCKIQRPN